MVNLGVLFPGCQVPVPSVYGAPAVQGGCPHCHHHRQRGAVCRYRCKPNRNVPKCHSLPLIFTETDESKMTPLNISSLSKHKHSPIKSTAVCYYNNKTVTNRHQTIREGNVAFVSTSIFACLYQQGTTGMPMTCCSACTRSCRPRRLKSLLRWPLI